MQNPSYHKDGRKLKITNGKKAEPLMKLIFNCYQTKKQPTERPLVLGCSFVEKRTPESIKAKASA